MSGQMMMDFNPLEESTLEKAKKHSVLIGKVSLNALQRALKVSYADAVRIVEQLAAEGFCKPDFDWPLGGWALIPQEESA